MYKWSVSLAHPAIVEGPWIFLYMGALVKWERNKIFKFTLDFYKFCNVILYNS